MESMFMLAFVGVLLGFSLPLGNLRALPQLPLKERGVRRAPLAENAWEENVLENLTLSTPSWE